MELPEQKGQFTSCNSIYVTLNVDYSNNDEEDILVNEEEILQKGKDKGWGYLARFLVASLQHTIIIMKAAIVQNC